MGEQRVPAAAHRPARRCRSDLRPLRSTAGAAARARALRRGCGGLLGGRVDRAAARDARLEGLGAALVVPTTIAALRGAFAGPRLGFALGLWLAAALGGAATGPVIGGLLIAGFSWRAVFWPQVALGLVATLLALPVVRDRGGRRSEVSVRLGGLAVVALALAALVAGLIRAGAAGWGSGQALAPIGAGVGLLGAVAWLAARSARRSGVLGGTDVAGLSAGLLVLVLAFVGNVGVYFLVSIWLQRVVGLSPLAAGVQLLPTAGLAAIASPLGGRLVARLGPERPLAAGLLLQIGSLLGLATLGGGSSYADALPFLVLFGLSVALIPTAAFTVVMRSVAPERSGLASGAQTCALNLGAVLSVAVLGTIVASAVAARYGDALTQVGLGAHVPSAAAIADVSQGIAEAPAGAGEATLAAFRQASAAAFSGAMGLALRVGAGFVLAALAVVAALSLQRRRSAI
ncbi:MAG: MFS transporter [Thermoleophilia bacterium]